MKWRLSLVEDLYLSLCVLVFYLTGGAAKEVSIGLGYLACFLFFPSYPVLFLGIEMVRVRTLLLVSSASAALILCVQYFLNEDSALQMCVLFMFSYFASKPFRFFVTSVSVSNGDNA